MTEETIRFLADGIPLHGTLHLPETPDPPVVIGVHGLLSTGDSPKQLALAERLNRWGIAFFRFDHRGCGRSQGKFSEVTTFDGRCRDLAAAIQAIFSRISPDRPLGLFGSSMGGAVCLAMAGAYDIRAVVTLAAPVRLSSIRVPLGYENDPALAGMNARQMEFDISNQLARIKNLLIFHGDNDQVVPFGNAEEIFKKTGHTKKLVRLEGADHPLSEPTHQKIFLEQTADWFIKLLMLC